MSYSYYAVVFHGFRVKAQTIETQERTCSHVIQPNVKFCPECGCKPFRTVNTCPQYKVIVEDDDGDTYHGLDVMYEYSGDYWWIGERLGHIEPRGGDGHVEIPLPDEIDQETMKAQLLADGFEIDEFGIFLVPEII